MAQSDMVISDQVGASFLPDINSVLAALATNSSGATEPATTYAFQPWADTTADRLKIRNAANDGWVSVLVLSTGAPVSGVSAGLITASGLTQATARLLGRSTAGTGAVEEIDPSDDFILDAGALALSKPTVLGTPVTVTGNPTAVDIAVAVPAYANEFTLNISGLSTSNTAQYLVQFAVAGSPVTTGYRARSTRLADSSPVSQAGTTAGFIINLLSGSALLGGSIVFRRVSGNTWTASGNLADTGTSQEVTVSGDITLAGAISGIRFTTVGGTNTIDNGSILNTRYCA